MGNEYQKFNEILKNYCGKVGKAAERRDLTVAFGMSRLARGRAERGGLVFLSMGLLLSVEH